MPQEHKTMELVSACCSRIKESDNSPRRNSFGFRVAPGERFTFLFVSTGSDCNKMRINVKDDPVNVLFIGKDLIDQNCFNIL